MRGLQTPTPGNSWNQTAVRFAPEMLLLLLLLYRLLLLLSLLLVLTLLLLLPLLLSLLM